MKLAHDGVPLALSHRRGLVSLNWPQGLPYIQQELHFTHAGCRGRRTPTRSHSASLLMLGARAGDIVGRQRMFIYGLALFTLASLAIGLAPSPAWLLASRAIQGASAAILAPSTLALLSTHFAEGPERTGPDGA